MNKTALAACYPLVCRLDYFSTLKMEEICSPRTLRNRLKELCFLAASCGVLLVLLFDPYDGRVRSSETSVDSPNYKAIYTLHNPNVFMVIK
jgi:hypothetical protein